MRAPAFWWNPAPTGVARLLAPAAAIYGAVAARRMDRPGRRLDVPVICIGNFVAGGAGKTPTAMAVCTMLVRQGFTPAFVSRGYGRRAADRSAVLRVDGARDTADRVGDEPLLLARHAPTFVATDRRRAAEQAVADGATVILLDDGMQNPSLATNFTLAVVDGARGFGNGQPLPAGPLRAPLSSQWPHLSAVCRVGPGRAGLQAADLARAAGKPVWSAELRPDPEAVARLTGRRLLAFAGIAHPPKFFATLRAHGLDPVAERTFPDHHRYRPAELTALRDAADQLGAELVTTDKDRARLPADFPALSLPVDLVFDDEAAVLEAIGRAISASAGTL